MTQRTRQCVSCKSVLPETKEHFVPVERADGDALSYTCIECNERAKRSAKMAVIEKTAVEHLLEVATTGGSKIPHTAEVLESIMHYFGGTNGFASVLLKQYFDSPPGSRIRSGVLEMILRLTAKNTEQGGARKPLQLYSEEELEEEIDERIRQAASLTKYGAGVIDGAIAQQAEPLPIEFSAGRAEELAGGIEVEAARSLKAISANTKTA